MDDPHVAKLIYDLVLLDSSASFKSPPTVQITQPSFTAKLEDECLTIVMGSHFAEVQDARQSIEPTLRAWEASALLDGRNVEFRRRDARIIDRDRPHGEVGISLSEYRIMLPLAFGSRSVGRRGRRRGRLRAASRCRSTGLMRANARHSRSVRMVACSRP